MALPPLTQEQRLLGLARANEARQHRAALKRALTARQTSLADVLALGATGDATVGRTAVLEILRAVPGVGAVTAGKLLAEAGVSERRRVQGLGRRQRQALLDAVARRGL